MPPPAKRERVSPHRSESKAESLPLPKPAAASSAASAGKASALGLDLHGGPHRELPGSDMRKPSAGGQGISPHRPVAPSRVEPSSMPPAPEGKPGLFVSTVPGPSQPAQPSTPPAAGGRPAASGGGNLFSADDDDDEWDAGGALDVGLDYGSEAPPAMASPVSQAASQPGATGDGSPDVALVDPGPVPPPATGRAPLPSQGLAPPAAAVATTGAGPIFSAAEIETVARYGEVPSNVLLAPVYAVRVFKRRQELKKLLTLQQRTHEQATTTLRGKLADITDGIVAQAPEQLDGVMGPVRTAEQKVRDRKVQLEAASGQFASQFKSLELEIEAAGKQRQQLDRDRNMAQIKLEDAVHKRAQVTADLKRINLGIASAHDAAANAAGADASFATPEHAKRITALEAEKAKRVEQVRGRDKAVGAAKLEVREREAAIRQLESRVNAIHGRQSNMEGEAGQAQTMGLDALKGAQHERLVAYEVAIDTIVAQAKSLVDQPTKAQIEDVKRQIAGCNSDLDKHNLAVDAFDDGAYKRGIAIAVVLVVLIVFGLISVARVQ